MLNRVKGFMLGRIAVLSAVWNHPLNRGSRTKAIRDYFVWNAARFWIDARHIFTLTDTVDIILGKRRITVLPSMLTAFPISRRCCF